jgi:sn-glycerol 3-phosphate transport system ATP-binding protein
VLLPAIRYRRWLPRKPCELSGGLRQRVAMGRAIVREPSVYVTHDQVEAMTLGHRLVVLNEGRVEQLGNSD